MFPTRFSLFANRLTVSFRTISMIWVWAARLEQVGDASGFRGYKQGVCILEEKTTLHSLKGGEQVLQWLKYG